MWARWLVLSIVVVAIGAVPRFALSDTSAPVPNYISSKLSRALVAWIALHQEYRVAIDTDCSCADSISRVREGHGWPPSPNFHPYYAAGDFNGDSEEDLAVGVISRQHPKKFRVLILNGTSSRTLAPKEYLSGEFPLGWGLFFGAPRPKPWRLIVGPFEAEGATFEPTPSGYKLVADESEDE